MKAHPPRRIPEWLSLQDIARAWSDETGESAGDFEGRFRTWFKDYLLRNDYGDADGEESGISAEVMEGRQIWRETFETFCEERGEEKPRFWFPEPGQAPAPPDRDVTPDAPPPADSADTIANAPDPDPEEKKQVKPPPPRLRVREGSTSFTWIAAGLVAIVAAGLVALWMRDMERPIVEQQEAGQERPGPLVTVAPSPEPTSTEPTSPERVPPEQASAPVGGSDPVAGSQVSAVTELASAPATAPAGIDATAPEMSKAGDDTDSGSTPAATPEPTTASAPAAAQIAAASLSTPMVARATAASLPSEPPDEGLILLIQRELRTAGFDPGPIDGKLGTRFAAAISKYQRANGLPANGQPSIGLLSRLARENLKAGRSAEFLPPASSPSQPSSPPPKVTGADNSAKQPDHKDTRAAPSFKLSVPSLKPIPMPRGRNLVRSIQQRLSTRGYYDGPVDGDLGPKTREAIRSYQRMQRYPATGQPSRALFEELEDHALEVRALDEFRKGAYEAAVATYSRIIQRNPKLANAYFNRGLAYNSSGHNEQALADYATAIKLDPGHDKAYFDRANIRYQQGLYRDAVRDYYKALTLWLGIG